MYLDTCIMVNNIQMIMVRLRWTISRILAVMVYT
nr:MAG TPA: hypothetical protein [Caudoviricetes sp.]